MNGWMDGQTDEKTEQRPQPNVTYLLTEIFTECQLYAWHNTKHGDTQVNKNFFEKDKKPCPNTTLH